MSLLARDGSIQKISGVKLHSGLVGRDLDDPATGGLIGSRGEPQAPGFAIDHKIVVVALC